jgi:hypothetical protein
MLGMWLCPVAAVSIAVSNMDTSMAAAACVAAASMPRATSAAVPTGMPAVLSLNDGN